MSRHQRREVLCLQAARAGTRTGPRRGRLLPLGAELRPSPRSPWEAITPTTPGASARGASGEFTCRRVRGHPGGPSLGQAECPVHRWAVPLPALTPVTARGIDTALGTAAPSSPALIHVCGKGLSGRGAHPEPPRDPPIGGLPRTHRRCPEAPPPLGGRNQPHLSGRCRPAILQGSGSGRAGHSSLRSGTAAGILLWVGGEACHQLRRVPRAPQGWQPGKGCRAGDARSGFERQAAGAWPRVWRAGWTASSLGSTLTDPRR